MKYPDNTNVSLGDLVWVNEGVNIGLVSLILERSEQWEEWGLSEPGFFVCLDLSGRSVTQDLFVSQEEFEREGIGRLTDSEAKELANLYVKVSETDGNAAGESYGVLRHKARRGIPWIFGLGGRNNRDVKYYGVFASGEIRKLSKGEVFD